MKATVNSSFFRMVASNLIWAWMKKKFPLNLHEILYLIMVEIWKITVVEVNSSVRECRGHWVSLLDDI